MASGWKRAAAVAGSCLNSCGLLSTLPSTASLSTGAIGSLNFDTLSGSFIQGTLSGEGGENSSSSGSFIQGGGATLSSTSGDLDLL